MAWNFESFGFVILEWILGGCLIFFVLTCREYLILKPPGKRTALDGMYQHVFEYNAICLSTMLIKGLLYAIYSHEIPDHLDDLLDWIIFALFIAPTLQVIFSAYLKLTFVFNYHNPLEFDDKDILKVARGLTLTLTIGTIGLLIHFEDQKGKENRIVTLAIVGAVLMMSSQVISRLIICLKFGLGFKESQEIISCKTIAVLLITDIIAVCIMKALNLTRFDHCFTLQLTFLMPLIYQILSDNSNLREYVKRKYFSRIAPKFQNTVNPA